MNLSDDNQSQGPNGLELKVAELEAKYLRSLADYQNLEKQTEAWRQEYVQYANDRLVNQLLEVLDDLEKAADHLNDEGLKIAIDKLQKILKNNGLEEIAARGKDFDPNLMEAIETVPGGEEHKVVEVTQKGYKLNDKVIRSAKVTVSVK